MRLLDDLGQTLDVADGGQRRHDVAVPAEDLAALRLEPFGDLGDSPFQRLAESDVHEFIAGPDQMIQKKISLEGNWFVTRFSARQDKMAVDAGFRAGGCRLAAVVALHAAAPDEEVRTLPLRLGQDELVVPRLVAAEHQARAIVALDRNRRPANSRREPGERFQGRRPMRERITGKLLDAGAQLGRVHVGRIHSMRRFHNETRQQTDGMISMVAISGGLRPRLATAAGPARCSCNGPGCRDPAGRSDRHVHRSGVLPASGV